MGLAFSLIASAAGMAHAWYRTVSATGTFIPPDGGRVIIQFPSDGTSGTPNGNSATAIYADFYITGLPSGATQQVRMTACGMSFNGSGGGCGAPLTNSYTSDGFYDVSLPKWIGTGGPWDYFSVALNNLGGGGTVYAAGIGVVGT
jgi:hypothetical protein